MPEQRARSAGSRPVRADLLPVEYYHVVFTLPAPIADIAYQNKAVIYGLLFDVAAEVLMTIAADPRHLGARIGATLVLHTWGSALTHHPHVHGVVPWRRALAGRQVAGSAAGPGSSCPCECCRGCSGAASSKSSHTPASTRANCSFFGEHAPLADAGAFAQWLAPLRTVRVGGLRQATVRRTDGGARLSVALHAPRGDLQQPAAQLWTSAA